MRAIVIAILTLVALAGWATSPAPSPLAGEGWGEGEARLVLASPIAQVSSEPPLTRGEAATFPTRGEATTFATVDIYVTSATPLAAYQLELTDAASVARIVGIEGGEPAPFRDAPYYDPQAIQRDRVILAAFSTASPSDLPRGKVRVATVHVQFRGVRGSGTPRWNAKLVTAANASGEAITAEVSLDPGTPGTSP
jgi:hypothetical protein